MISDEAQIFNHPFFQGHPDAERIDGSERKHLDGDEQRRRWDYFFRPDLEMIHLWRWAEQSRARSAVVRHQSEIKRLQGDLIKNWIFIGVIGVLGIILAVAVHPYVIAVALGGLYFVPKLIRIRRDKLTAEEQIRKEEQLIQEIIRERSQLLAQAQQIGETRPTPDEMGQFVSDNVEVLRVKAQKALNIGEGDIILVKEIDPIYDWALLQGIGRGSDTARGRGTMNPHHLKAYYGAVFCTYYTQFIFPTKDHIDSYGEFYDVILNRESGIATDEYYYRHITNINTRTTEIEGSQDIYFLGSGKVIETTEFRMTASSGESISVTLMGEAMRRSLTEYTQDRQMVANADSLTELENSASSNVRSDIEANFKERAAAAQRLQDDNRVSAADDVVRAIRAELRDKQSSL